MSIISFVDAFDWLDPLARELRHEAATASRYHIIRRDVKALRRLSKAAERLDDQVDVILDIAMLIDQHLAALDSQSK